MKNVTLFLAVALTWGAVQAQERAFLGIESKSLSPEKAEALAFDNPFGSYISRVLSNTAAERAGLQPLDYVFGIDENFVAENKRLTSLLSQYTSGDEATIHYYSKGKKKKARITFGSRQEARSPQPEREKAFLGINRHPDNDDEARGVRVYALENHAARSMGLQDGDLILSINGHPMVDWQDITLGISNIEAGSQVSIEFEREGKKQKVAGTIGSQDERNTFTQTREYPFLGIYSEKLSPEKARKLGFENPYGSYVTRVINGTAADRAGLQPFDYLYGIDEYRAGENQSITQILRKFEPEQKVELLLVRKGKKQQKPVVLGRKSDAKGDEGERDKCDKPFFGVSPASQSGDAQGVKVNIVDGSTAEAAGMENGDIITNINGYTMIDWNDISTAIGNLEVGQTIRVEFLRAGKKEKAVQPIKSYCETKPGKSLDMGIAPRPGEWFDRYFSEEEEEVSGAPAAPLAVNIREVSSQEVTALNVKDKLQPSANNRLVVERLSLRQNPNGHKFDLEFFLPTAGETGIRILNESGRLIYSFELGNFSGDFKDQTDISQNGTGKYFLEIKQGERSFSRAIVLSNK